MRGVVDDNYFAVLDGGKLLVVIEADGAATPPTTPTAKTRRSRGMRLGDEGDGASYRRWRRFHEASLTPGRCPRRGR